MGEAEQVMWGFFNMGRLISAMSFIGTIIAIWLALRIANMTRASEESNIVTKILSSAFGILVLGGAYTGASIGRANWTNTANIVSTGGVDNCANPAFCQSFLDFVGTTEPSLMPTTGFIIFLVVILIMILGQIWLPKNN